MKRNQIIGIIIVVVLVFGGIISWTLLQKGKIYPKEEVIPEVEEIEEVFSLSGIVSGVDAENNFLMVKPVGEEREVKLILSETVRLIKLEFPFDPKSPPKEGTFTTKQTEIKISDFKTGDNVFIKAKENIAGQSEFNNIDFIHILP